MDGEDLNCFVCIEVLFWLLVFFGCFVDIQENVGKGSPVSPGELAAGGVIEISLPWISFSMSSRIAVEQAIRGFDESGRALMQKALTGGLNCLTSTILRWRAM